MEQNTNQQDKKQEPSALMDIIAGLILVAVALLLGKRKEKYDNCVELAKAKKIEQKAKKKAA